MAGKSTVLRSTAAVALCSMCGFLVPAQRARVPDFDGLELHTFVGDDPAEEMSGFAVEMNEMRQVLLHATNKTLVLIDELGKGTEATAGACLSAAMLKEFDERAILGIFATHLHKLHDLPMLKHAPNMIYKQMTTRLRKGSGDQLEPTWEMVNGCSTRSLAFEVASDRGIPSQITENARGFYQMLTAAENEASVAKQQPLHASSSVPEAHSNGSASSSQVLVSHVGHLNGACGNGDAQLAEQGDPNPFEFCQGVLMETLQHHLDRLGVPLQDNECAVCGADERPPPYVAEYSCVYLLQRSKDSRFYVGQTDDFTDRWQQHRSNPDHGRLRAAYVCLPKASRGKTDATTIESALIRRLQDSGVLLWSTSDAKHRLR